MNNNNDDELFLKLFKFKNIKENILNNLSTSKYKVFNNKFNYYEINESQKLSKNKEWNSLLKSKVYNNELLSFNFTEHQIPFYYIFKTFQDSSTTEHYEFYQQLFNNYQTYFMDDQQLERMVLVSIETDNLISLELIFNQYLDCDDQYISNCFNHSILNGSIKVSNYFYFNFSNENQKLFIKSKINDLEIWEKLLNRSDDDDYFKINKSIYYLFKINSPIPSNKLISSINSIIDFDISNENITLQFILESCYSIQFIMNNNNNNQNNFNNNKLSNLKLLNKFELDNISNQLSTNQLSTSLLDLEFNKENENEYQILKQLIGMSIKFTNKYFNENLYFYNLKFNENESNISSTSSSGNSKFLKYSIMNGDFNEFLKNDGFNLSNYENISSSIKLFRFCKNNYDFKFIKDSIDYLLNLTNEQELKSNLNLLLIQVFIKCSNLESIKKFLNEINNNSKLISQINLMNIFKNIESIQLFDLIYQNFKNDDRFNFSNFLMIPYGNNNSSNSTTITKKESSKHRNILNHFKINYSIDYYKLIESSISSSFDIDFLNCKFIFDNFKDFKNKFENLNIWSLLVDTCSSLEDGGSNEDNQNYYYVVEWLIENNQVISLEYGSNKIKPLIIYSYYFYCKDGIKRLLEIKENAAAGLDNERIKQINQSLLLIKSYMIKRADFPSLEYLFENVDFSNDDINETMILISNYNRVDILSFIFTYFPKLLTKDALDILFNYSIFIFGSLDVLDYLIQIIKHKPTKLNNLNYKKYNFKNNVNIPNFYHSKF